jgi:hypothetical protein
MEGIDVIAQYGAMFVSFAAPATLALAKTIKTSRRANAPFARSGKACGSTTRVE